MDNMTWASLMMLNIAVLILVVGNLYHIIDEKQIEITIPKINLTELKSLLLEHWYFILTLGIVFTSHIHLPYIFEGIGLIKDKIKPQMVN